MIIDFHTHIFPDKIAQKAINGLKSASHVKNHADGTAADLVRSMERSGVCLSVIQPVAVKPGNVVSINNISIERSGRDNLIYFGCMHPDFADYDAELRRLRDSGIKGIKLHPVSQDTDLDDARYLRIMERCLEYGLIVLVHGGTDLSLPDRVRSTPKMAENALRQVGEVSLVMAHMGGHHFWDDVPILAQYDNVYIDTSTSLGKIISVDGYYSEEEKMMLSDEEFCRIVRLFGADRTLFASDSPWSDQKKSIDDITALPLSDSEKELIFHKNAMRLLNLN